MIPIFFYNFMLYSKTKRCNMKKLFFFLAAGSIAMNMSAQELRHGSMVNTINPIQDRKIDAVALRNDLQQRFGKSANKTTAGSPRWYNYGSAIDTSQNYYNNITLGGGPSGNGTFFGLGTATIWKDTNGTALYTGGVYQHITDVSEAAVFDPKAQIFNREMDGAYIGQYELTNSNAYTWDSVALFGVYSFNKTKTTVVDTLRCVFVVGDGSGSSDIFSGFKMGTGGHYPGVSFFDMIWDSVTNTASTRTFTTTYKFDVILNSARWADTNKNGIWSGTIPTNGATGISVPAGSICGMSITFISGDIAATTGAGKLATPTPGDTLLGTWLGSGMNRYNVWRPIVAYYANAGNAVWAPYQCPSWEANQADNNLGYWKRLPNTPANWDDVYIPTWAWNSGGGASSRQYPYISWHVVCASCGTLPSTYLGLNNVTTVNNINAVPNPANDELNIIFSLTQASDVSVTLTNMIGQVVGTQKLSNIATGKAVFNTAALPSGVYVYSLEANGEHATGRVTIAH